MRKKIVDREKRTAHNGKLTFAFFHSFRCAVVIVAVVVCRGCGLECRCQLQSKKQYERVLLVARNKAGKNSIDFLSFKSFYFHYYYVLLFLQRFERENKSRSLHIKSDIRIDMTKSAHLLWLQSKTIESKLKFIDATVQHIKPQQNISLVKQMQTKN